MDKKLLHTDHLRSASYDARSFRLEIEFNSGDVRSYRGVPEEVARRFFASPNPETFWEDSIAEEYSWERAHGTHDASARASLDALFRKPGKD